MSRRRERGQAGFTILEMMIAMTIGLFVVIALGRIIVASQESWEWGRDKVVLQQNVQESLAWVTQAVRAASSLSVPDSNQVRTYDSTGALLHTYRRLSVSGVYRLQQDGQNLTPRTCTRFRVLPNADTTSVTLTLELQDNENERVCDMTRITVRGRTFAY